MMTYELDDVDEHASFERELPFYFVFPRTKGYYVSIMYTSARKFHIELAKCAVIGEITQEGDTEGVIFILRETALNNARLIRTAIHAKRIRETSPEAKAAGAERLRNWRKSQRSGAVVGAGQAEREDL